MKLANLAWHSLWARRSSALLTVMTIALSVALLLGVEQLRLQTKQSFASTVSGTDLIVGARSGQTQLLLYSIFHIGNATNNISWSSYQDIAAQRNVKWTIPIALGDSHRGYRVVGTNSDFFEYYRYGRREPLSFAQGNGFETTFEAVLGAEVARSLGYELGQEIVVAHGVAEISFNVHDQHPFEVVGILAPTGTPVDRSVMVGLDAIEAIHMPVQPDGYTAEQLEPKSITAFLMGMNSRVQVFTQQRAINNYRAEPLLAILPGVALQELWGVLGMAEQALLAVSVCVVLTGLLSMLAALLASLKERRREMAILRSVGARPYQIFLLLVLESLLLSVAGVILGALLKYALLAALQPFMLNQMGLYLTLGGLSNSQWQMLLAVVMVGTFSGMIPAWRAYRYSLNDGMSIRV
ncbi:ABC transporter permease [Aliagarivorans taiwanensis]|uniref:ABC transporter permease n=1 Tax=Aliagarivorans taiwanensis TaxID=561966 RepID=UPI0004094D2A|nr:ABC transporter permease [Aliagarivorans taiwanensis]